MRCYILVAGTLFSAASVFAQQTGRNVVPNEAMRGAIHRALTSPTPRPLTLKRSFFQGVPTSTVCAIPLLETTGVPTHDRIAQPRLTPPIDPKMVLPPAIPACPTESPKPLRR